MTKKISIKKNSKIEKALSDVKAHYSELAANWAQLTAAQKRDVLDKSPILREFVALFGVFGGGA